MPLGKKQKTIGGTISEYADSTGTDGTTIRRALAKVEEHPENNEFIPLSIYLKAFYSEDYVEGVRGQRLRNEQLEREAAEEMGKLYPLDKLTEWMSACFVIPLSNIFASAPMMLAARCNPADPELARKAIEEWLEKVMKPALRKALDKPPKVEKE